MGAYFNRGDNSIVELYVDAIEAKAKNPYDTMLLMGQVLLHEYFHSFYFHVGTGMRNPMKCMEEPMADYGSLVALEHFDSAISPYRRFYRISHRSVAVCRSVVAGSDVVRTLTKSYGL